MLKESAISGDVARARGYWSATQPKQLERWFGMTQRRLVPALVIPTFDVTGEVAFCQLRPDEPRVVDSRTRKYELPHRARMVVDVPPAVRPALGNPAVPLLITEGARKADAAVTAGLNAVDLVGVWTWRGRNGDDGLTALACFESIALNDRVVFLAFDSDAMTKREVHMALGRFAAFLRKRKADVRFVYLPNGVAGAKMGLDDYLATGATRDDVLALASDVLRPLGGRAALRPVEAPAEVDGADLLHDVRAFITRHMVLPSAEVADLLALWVLHTHASDAAWSTPYLRITSAAADSGKTVLMEILAALCRRGWHAVNPSAAVLYRKVDAWTPTLLLDELDNYPLDERRDALAVLNCGYKRGATVDRCKENGELEEFKCFCPKAYAGLDQKALVRTLLSRSITIRLKPKTAHERVEMWIEPLAGPDAEPLRERCAAWAHHNVERLRTARPEDWPPGFTNRAVEIWWPLLAVADQVGAGWPERARAAARVLSAGGDTHDARGGDVTQLLADIRDLLGGEHAVSTETLLAKLNALDESPWGARRRGEGLDARGLAALLRPLGIRPRTVRVGEATPKGYLVEQFADAFARHLADTLDYPPHPPHTPHLASHAEPDVADVADVADTEGGARTHNVDALAEPACHHEDHRHADWAMPNAAMWVCGVCHPPSDRLRELALRFRCADG